MTHYVSGMPQEGLAGSLWGTRRPPSMAGAVHQKTGAGLQMEDLSMILCSVNRGISRR